VRLRLLPLCLLPLAVAACGASTRPAPPKAAASNAPAAKAYTIRVTSVVRSTRTHHKSAQVTTPGDRIDFQDDLLNTAPRFGKAANAKIGSDKGTMTFTSAHTATMTGVATLPDGTIRFDGVVTVLPNKWATVPVTGGTGKYHDASGTLLVGSGVRRAINTYTLLVDGLQGPVA